MTPAGPEVRLVVATHGATSSSPTVGVEQDGTVYELFVSTLPSPAFITSQIECDKKDWPIYSKHHFQRIMKTCQHLQKTVSKSRFEKG